MAMTNAERQARWRERHRSELQRARAISAKLDRITKAVRAALDLGATDEDVQEAYECGFPMSPEVTAAIRTRATENAVRLAREIAAQSGLDHGELERGLRADLGG